ncbi:uncharacterized protein LOC129226425 [Uloborus diversus]|uniref:uncharacterized protein LOC129226425 n=1 Tax=Uloborus diversus TaxID=327109 RepID=UPI0024096CE3|nr:uncharacterized protein LOC129226425 [Uloborus diversus]
MISTDKLVRLTCYAVLSEVLYMISSKLFKKLQRPKKNSLTQSLKEQYDKENSTDEFHKVLFFPDSGIVCRRTSSGRICRDKNCAAVHDETSLSVLINLLNLSQKSIDVCVYFITCSLLGDTLVECHKKGIKVRVITEERNSGEEGEICGAQIGKLRASGQYKDNTIDGGAIYGQFERL